MAKNGDDIYSWLDEHSTDPRQPSPAASTDPAPSPPVTPDAPLPPPPPSLSVNVATQAPHRCIIESPSGQLVGSILD